MENIIVCVVSEDLYYNPWSVRHVYRKDVSEALWRFLGHSNVVEYKAHSPEAKNIPSAISDGEENTEGRGWSVYDIETWGAHADEIVNYLDERLLGPQIRDDIF